MAEIRPLIAALALAGLLAGCATTPTAPPQLELPQGTLASAPVELERWWTSFQDPALTGLIDEALANNVDVLAAQQRLAQSRAELGLANSAFLPEVGLALSGSRGSASGDVQQPRQAQPTPTGNQYRGGLTLSYEIDLSGRLRAARTAADARLAASRYAREGTAASVAGQVAKAYFTLLHLDADQALATQALSARQEALGLRHKLLSAGMARREDIQLAEAQLASTRASLVQTEALRERAEASLAVLLGRSPRQIMAAAPPREPVLAKLAQAPEIPAGLHAELLQRRPDVRAAEAQLVAASAGVDEARARYFPSLSLSGFFGGESLSLSNLLESSTRTWNIGAAIAQPLVGLYRVGRQVEQAQAVREQVLLTYQQTARQAYADTRAALAAHRAAREQLVAAESTAKAVAAVSELTNLRLRQGAASRLDLLDVENDRLSVERNRATALRDRVNALVDVYQALGGGWSETVAAKAQ
ncbi:efflux transporter outer membrane subunit [Chitinimonas lacunae]|uniref:Efflux transporter outer membrane subunit n=1 Tax=Chitinimonas lacunae TaxID=1963018 RepID=A0ABV8MIR9_9NEIS